MKVGDFVVERLHAWGVRRIYGYPGDGINGVIGALQRAGNIEFIQVRHEEMAAFMAVAHAKFTGVLGVCLSTGGPGATHLITGLYDGKLDHAPVLAICGQAEATVRGASYQQELNLDRMFADVAGFVQEASSPAQVRHLLDRCVRVAKATNAPSVIILPKDIQDEEYQEPAVAHGFTRSGVGYSRPKMVPEDADLTKAAEILNAGKKVAMRKPSEYTLPEELQAVLRATALIFAPLLLVLLFASSYLALVAAVSISIVSLSTALI